MFSGGPDDPPLNVILSAIMPSTVYHLVFTPILPFPYCNPTEEFFSTWRWRVHNRLPHKQVTLLQAIDDAYNDQCQAWICHARRFFSPRCLTNENIHYDVDENLWPNPQDRVDKTEEQWGTLQLTFYCRPNVVFSYLFYLIFSYLKFFEKPVVLIISSIIFKCCLMIPVSVLFSLVYYNDVWMCRTIMKAASCVLNNYIYSFFQSLA